PAAVPELRGLVPAGLLPGARDGAADRGGAGEVLSASAAAPRERRTGRSRVPHHALVQEAGAEAPEDGSPRGAGGRLREVSALCNDPVPRAAGAEPERLPV